MTKKTDHGPEAEKCILIARSIGLREQELTPEREIQNHLIYNKPLWDQEEGSLQEGVCYPRVRQRVASSWKKRFPILRFLRSGGVVMRLRCNAKATHAGPWALPKYNKGPNNWLHRARGSSSRLSGQVIQFPWYQDDRGNEGSPIPLPAASQCTQ